MCKTVQAVIAVIVGLLAIWPGLIGSAGRWILLLAAVILLIHPWMCKACGCCESCQPEMSKKKGKKK